MNNTLKYIKDKFQIDLDQKSPIKLPIDKSRGLPNLFNELGFKIGVEIGYVINDIAEWSKKVKPGGIISGHDYWRSIESKKPSYIENLTLDERIS